MNRPPLRGPFTFLAPPLKPRMRDVMVDTGLEAAGNLSLNLTQRRQDSLLFRL
jgi:hypothetical protein